MFRLPTIGRRRKVSKAFEILNRTGIPTEQRLEKIRRIAGPSAIWVEIGRRIEHEELERFFARELDAMLSVHQSIIPETFRRSLLYLLGEIKPYSGEYWAEAAVYNSLGRQRLREKAARREELDRQRESKNNDQADG